MHRPRSRFRVAATLAVVAAGTAVVVGRAAGLGVSSTTLGAAQVAVTRCTTGGIGLIENVPSGNRITSVTLSGIPASCDGAVLTITVSDGSATGQATLSPVTAGSTTLTLSASVQLTAATEADLVLNGP